MPALAALPQDTELDSYGGWTGKKLNRTGFFYATNILGRWWLVDPEGGLFLNKGITAIEPMHTPNSEVAFQTVFGTETNWAARTVALLHQNGFNVAGAWSSSSCLRTARRRWFTHDYGTSWALMAKNAAAPTRRRAIPDIPKIVFLFSIPTLKHFAMSTRRSWRLTTMIHGCSVISPTTNCRSNETRWKTICPFPRKILDIRPPGNGCENGTARLRACRILPKSIERSFSESWSSVISASFQRRSRIRSASFVPRLAVPWVGPRQFGCLSGCRAICGRRLRELLFRLDTEDGPVENVGQRIGTARHHHRVVCQGKRFRFAESRRCGLGGKDPV